MEITKRELLSVAASSRAAVHLTNIGSTSVQAKPETPDIPKKLPDVQVYNNRGIEQTIEIRLFMEGNSIQAFKRTLAGRQTPKAQSLPQSATSTVRLNPESESVYTVRALVGGQIEAKRQLALTKDGIPDYMSIFVDVRQDSTDILYSEV